jgi:hypothetical protein
MSQFGQMVPIASIGPFNVGLHSAQQDTMESMLGRPKPGLTTNDQPDHASDQVRALLADRKIDHFHLQGIRPAVDSLAAVLAQVKANNATLYAALGSDGMLVVRLRRPTSGRPSKAISNHAWGTAIDFSVDGSVTGASGARVPRGIALMVPYMNKAGWYSGIAFHDDMHFEVAEETIHAWAASGQLTAAAHA